MSSTHLNEAKGDACRSPGTRVYALGFRLAAHQMKKQGTKQKNGVETALTTVLKTGDRKQMRSRNDRLFEASEPAGALNQNGDSRLISI